MTTKFNNKIRKRSFSNMASLFNINQIKKKDEEIKNGQNEFIWKR